MVSYFVAVWGAARVAALWIIRHRITPAAIAGFAMGIAGWSAAHPFVASFGFSRETIAGLLLAAAGTFCLGFHLGGRWRGFAPTGLPALIAAASLVGLPIALKGATSLVAVVPVNRLAVDLICVPVLLSAALICFGLPACCVGFVTRRFVEAGFGRTLLLAAAAGIALNALLFAPAVGLQIPLLAVGVTTAVAWLARLIVGTLPGTATDAARETAPRSLPVTARSMASAALVALGCGISGRLLAQLAPESAYLLAAGVAALFAGLAAGGLLACRLCRREEGQLAAGRLGAVIAVAGLLLPMAVFGWLIERQLDANAFVSSVFWLMTIRIAIVTGAILPLAIGCGLLVGAERRSASTGSVACSLAVGIAAAGWLIPAFGVIPLVLSAACGLLAMQLAPVRSLVPQSRIGWGTAAVACVLLGVEAFHVGGYRPETAARLLFSTEAFIARQRGVPAELLSHLDDTRLVSTTETPAGAATLWKRSGVLCEMRIDGVPVASGTSLPTIAPLPSGDAMRVALPLILHEKPGSLLLLGDPLGVATQVAAGFPLREIVCYDGIGKSAGVSLLSLPVLKDDRVSVVDLEPRLALHAVQERFDVIVSDVATPAVLASTPSFTREFYEAARERLAEGGIFCQRLRYADFGPEPLRIMAATVKGVFGESMLVEVGGDEYVLLGVRPGQTLVRGELTERLQRKHVRRLLASLGWDWSMPLALIAVDQAGLDALAAEAAGPNSATDGRLAYSLPQETMRWGLKSVELQQATINRTTNLATRGVPADQLEDVLTRIGEVRVQHEMMTKYPDQPWAYRKEVKQRLVEQPRSVIRPVSGEVRRVLHPDDQRRLDYFEALSKAINQKSPETLAALERFAEPYDPLINYFLHHEIAPLYAEAAGTSAAVELAHRLHAAWFADPRDRSIRNVTAVIDMLVKEPELIADDTSRFDHLNGMVELLLARWEARGMAQPSSPEVVMVDIDLSLDAIETAIEPLETLAPAAGLSEADWQLRKSAIERTLTRPLRKYRTTLLPHVRAARQKAEEQAAKSPARPQTASTGDAEQKSIFPDPVLP